ncbi:hypothetical protein ONE63_006659 [Megalurothrips usitatus]|uniref:Uncharacterized protein n=1 Tax=Megalurothrips usitatus TaxID=439358 RepID=A0AAV7XXA9_9NEOP|nr:hypothetical protein ONE63_006659 [Megalurothrips usitatus]
MFVYYLGSVETHSLQFSAHLMIRYRWKDPRLAYSVTAPTISKVIGEKVIRERIWVPHVYLVNEHESKVMGADKEDVIVTVKPSGTVLFSIRIKVTMMCIMNLQKFPFDQQTCPMIFESWMYNTTEMALHWEQNSPVILDEALRLTEYSLSQFTANESFQTYNFTPDSESDDMSMGMGMDKFGGNYSRLRVDFQLKREVGHYIMDYYVPSILLVVVSWVSFWLDPNAVPGRTTLGTSTMLTFITLTRNSGSPLPKVSYIKATEIWFMVCTAFIFGSLVEFAFVNTIWRRKNNVELKKVNTKYVLKSTLTPTLHRKQLMERCRSCPDMVEEGRKPGPERNIYGTTNTLSVGSLESIHDPYASTYTLNSTLPAGSVTDCQDIVVPIPTATSKGYKAHNMAQADTGMSGPSSERPSGLQGFTTMTPQEIAQWIDRRSRAVFPISFVVFNILYWGFVWI